jgi:hypothetical protein
VVGAVARNWSRRLGGAASDILWTLLGQANSGAVVEGTWLANVRELTLAGLARAGADDIREMWCDVPVAIARTRFDARLSSRHPIHLDSEPDSLARWEVWSKAAEPMRLGAVHRVDTTKPVDVQALAKKILDVRHKAR